MHPLLRRQLMRLSLSPDVAPDAASWAGLIDRIDASYVQADQSRELVERSMTLSSQEMRELHARLRRANDELEEKVRERTRELEHLNASLAGEVEERRRAEAALAARERSIRLINDNLPVMIAYVDAGEIYRYHNRAFADWLGLGSSGIIGRSVREVVGEEGYGQLCPHIRTVLSGTATSFERVHQVRAGEETHVAGEFVPDVGGDGGVAGYYVMLLDVTARRRAERVALENEARFRSLTELSSDWYWEQDDSQRLVSTAGRADARGGVRAPALVGLRPWEMPDTEPLQGSWNAHREVMEQRRPFRDFIIRRKTSESVEFVSVSGAPVFDEHGVFTGYRGIAKNVTPLVRAEEEARTAREVLAKMLDAVPDPVFVKDEAHRYVHVNDAACAFFGWPRDALLGRSDRDFFPGEQADVFWAKDDAVFASGTDDVNEEQITSADGHTRTISTKKRAIRLPDGRQVLVGVIRDMTDYMTQQRLLSDAKEAAEAGSRAKSEFLARMSHEIRTPMNGVLGMTELLRGTALTVEQRRFVDAVHGSGEALLRIINDILDFSKIEAGKLALERVDFGLAECVQDTIELLRGRAAAKGLALDLRVGRGVPAVVRSDPARLRQVLTNLVGNAIKFTERGFVRIEVDRVDGDVAGAIVRFSVTDSGIGIPAQAQEYVFEAFAQADGSTSRRYGGTGLGLAICRQLVQLLGGEIGLRSRPGEGSTFWFTAHLQRVRDDTTTGPVVLVPAALALAQAKFQASARARAQTQPHGEVGSQQACARTSRLLLAEDNPINREVALAMLRSLGVAADTAEDGRAAVEAAARGGYDLVLMDCQMPEMDGFTATRAIRAREAGGSSRLPIVALTANAMRGDREACLEAGMDDYLSKPFSRAQLQAVIERWLGAAAGTRPAA